MKHADDVQVKPAPSIILINPFSRTTTPKSLHAMFRSISIQSERAEPCELTN